MQTKNPQQPVGKPSDYLGAAIRHQGAFSPQECDAIIQHALATPSQEGLLAGKNPQFYGHRKSLVRYIDYEPPIDWLFLKLRNLAQYANQFYRFDCHDIGERLQVAEYGVGDQFDWHIDLNVGASSVRKISISVQLSDSADYEGGDLEFFRQPVLPNDRSRGLIFFFPSYAPHRVAPVTRGKRLSLVAWVHGPSFR
jgi:PKHD-type hydroxylase